MSENKRTGAHPSMFRTYKEIAPDIEAAEKILKQMKERRFNIGYSIVTNCVHRSGPDDLNPAPGITYRIFCQHEERREPQCNLERCPLMNPIENEQARQFIINSNKAEKRKKRGEN